MGEGELGASADDPRIGMVLQDRYRVVRKIGEGGMGSVYEGEHVLIRRRVAIKCLHAQLATNPEIVARFHREAHAATSIGQQNIVEVTDMGRFDDGSVFMVLEYLDGRDWSHDIDTTGAQPLSKVIHIMDQVCDALTAAHAKGIIHRDLKPENIFLVQRGNDPDFVKVLDFGISKFKDAAGPGSSMTQTGTTLGTPYYMAPEQAQGKKGIDPRADLYSLGVILFQALTGQYPFDDESYPMLVLKICTEPPPPLRMYRPDLPEELELIVGKLLSKSPDDRFPDCAALKAALAPYRNIDAAPQLAIGAPSTSTMKSSLLERAATGASPVEAPSLTPVGVDLPRPSRLPLVLGGLAILLGVGIGVAAASGAFSSPVEVPEPPPEVDTQPPETSGTMESSPAVHVRIVSDPPQATLFLDGDPVGNPFDARLPVQREPRRIEARLEGYRTRIQDLSLQYEQNVTIQLERGAGTDDVRRPRETSETEPPIAQMTRPTMTHAAMANVPSEMANVVQENPSGMDATPMVSEMASETVATMEAEPTMQPTSPMETPATPMMDLIDIFGR